MSTIYIPVYHRPPNSFIGYTIEDGENRKLRIANYRDKNGKLNTVVAQVIWKDK